MERQYDNIFDTHAHYDDARFDQDRHQLLAELPALGVTRIVNVGCDIQSNLSCLALARKYPFVWCSVGIHPQWADKAPDGYLDVLAAQAQGEKVRAIGEIGLDYYYDDVPRDVQKRVFEEQLALAKDLNLPVIIHDRDAHQDTLELLRAYRPKGILHCFSGSAEVAQQVMDLGMYLGFTGVVTFKNANKTLKAVEAVRMDRLLLETDCPYMAPEPYRGKRCDSSMIARTAEAIARVKGLSPQELINAACENGRAVYGI